MSPTIPNGEPEGFPQQVEDSRIPRTEETREQTARAPLQYIEPTLFPEPKAQEGFVFRWVCEKVGGVQHDMNITKRLQEGWEHVDASEQPELCRLVGMKRADKRSPLRGSIRFLGQVLCKKPVEMEEARKRHFAKLASLQMDVVNSQNVALGPQPDLSAGIRAEHGGFRAPERDAQVVYSKAPNA